MGRLGPVPEHLSFSSPLDLVLSRLDGYRDLDDDLENCSDWLSNVDEHLAIAAASERHNDEEPLSRLADFHERW